ncbi:GSCOCG00010740001-RA-CDS, partial [Cotesia congregata]
MVIRRSSPSSLEFTETSSVFIFPAFGAWTTISIFMAEMTINGAPFSTESPTFTLMSITVPGMGAPTWFLLLFRQIFAHRQSFNPQSLSFLNRNIKLFPNLRPSQKNPRLKFINRSKSFFKLQIRFRKSSIRFPNSSLKKFNHRLRE